MNDEPPAPDNVEAELATRVSSELRDNEQLVWAGRPRPNRFARQAWPAVLFGIPWTAFAVFWTAAAAGGMFIGGNNAGGIGLFQWCFPLFGVPFILIGLVMLSAPYWARKKAHRTCYALTDHRAILWDASWLGTEIRSYEPAQLAGMFRVDYPGGDGDIIFEEVVVERPGRNRTTSTERRGFLGIGDVRRVEELIRTKLLLKN